jgi:GNAT superfamily N-acetyltransferase
VQLREIDPTAEWPVVEEIVRLRARVWTAQVPFPLTLEDLADPFDRVARHWAILDEDQLVAAARLSIHDRMEDVPEADCLHGVFPGSPPGPIAFLSRLVVAPEYRGRGLGRRLDEIRIRFAEQAGCRLLLALVFDASGEARIAQLCALGFTVRGRGCRDTHPTFGQLPPPVVLERLIDAKAEPESQ